MEELSALSPGDGGISQALPNDQRERGAVRYQESCIRSTKIF